nr:MAG TPA: hypothetical protein [Caudoviricetes sp.]
MFKLFFIGLKNTLPLHKRICILLPPANQWGL